jgi:uncharacterized membrane protein HdeD (DUF308 family)
MPLSEYELRVIAAMEEQLTTERPDPGAARLDRDAIHLVRYGVLASVVGLAVIIVTFRSSEFVAAMAFLAFFLGTVAAYEGIRSGAFTLRRIRRQGD